MFTRRNLHLSLAAATAVALTGGLLTLSAGAASAAGPAEYADDFDGDGDKDLLVSDGSGASVLFKGGAKGITASGAAGSGLPALFPQ